ncbi:uncharacterized protein BX663DRAFT_488237 [Cokeromyces recurvatus]|uniref:uncharacterized protein n=1 Tax=Cokeromyces recurvatus TaxID=90255 RepID=UPI002220FFD2|nr:uncharacterized protein BX663DRAFT_488237 [Cokeromyces recurvatus]KAI7900612.1 hypothetical protein BX663DRAFT_488237 [Cokeromyces recurvatus]
MRTISLVKRLKWSFSGNMNPHALVLGDVDNDNENEFVIGNLNGDLAIFKGHCDDGYPLYVCRGLGTITCIAIGDVRNTGKNSVVVINAEGHAHIFDISPKLSKMNTQNDSKHKHHISIDDYLKGGRRSSDTSSIQAFRHMMSGNTNDPLFQQQQHNAKSHHQTSQRIHDLGQPNLTLKVPVNVNKILIADIDNDNLNELILARTDRILHAFQLVPTDHGFLHFYKGIQTPFTSNSSSSAVSPSASSINLASLSKQHSPLLNHQQKKATEEANITTRLKLLDKNMWVFDGQISCLSMTSHPDRPDQPLLLVAQPGNTFTIIDQDGKRYNRDFTPQNTATNHFPNTMVSNHNEHSSLEQQKSSVLVEDPSIGINEDTTTFMHRTNYVVKNWPAFTNENNNTSIVENAKVDENRAVATEIVIGKRPSTNSEVVGMLSMDGKFSIYDLKTKTISERDLFVTHKLFSLATLDISTTPSYHHHRPPTKQQTSLSSSSSSPRQSQSSASSSASSSFSSSDDDNESIPWSAAEEDEDEEKEPGCNLFVACAWNGVTYLIDWSKTTANNKIKYQLVKFAFEGRVCAFTAGLYAVDNKTNVPCLFYVDFEDQIYVYYDVRIQPGPVMGFIDMIDDDIEEGLDRIMGIEGGIEALLSQQQQQQQKENECNDEEEEEEEENAKIDLGDGWQGIVDHSILTSGESQQDSDPLNLADFIHECLYEFHDMKDRMEKEVRQFEQNRLLNRGSRPGGDTGRRLSDLNITIEPPSIVDEDDTNNSLIVDHTIPISSDEEEEETVSHYERSENDRQHIESWIEDSLIDSSIFNKDYDDEDDDDDKHSTNTTTTSELLLA